MTAGVKYEQALIGIINEKESEDGQRLRALRELLLAICATAAEGKEIHLTTPFATIAYAGHLHQIPGHILYHAHALRKMEQDAGPIAIRVVADFIKIVFRHRLTPQLLSALPDPSLYSEHQSKVATFHPFLRVLVHASKPQSKLLLAYPIDRPSETIEIQYDLPNQDVRFVPLLEHLEKYFELPIEMNILDVEVSSAGIYMPRAFVIDPDYLMDITAIAGCFDRTDVSVAPYLLKKLLPRSTSIYLLIGNVANFFLDELMGDPNVSFNYVLKKIFRLDPLGFAQLNDADARRLVSSVEAHFQHLKSVIVNVFPKHGINPAQSYLEPSFYSDIHGLQGRLDVLFDHPGRQHEASIIELKSGKTFRPNTYGLNASHYVQTLLYDLLIKTSSGGTLKPTNYILYSQSEEDQLRFAPAVKSLQYEALAVRNLLLAIDRQLMDLCDASDSEQQFLKLLDLDRTAPTFVKRDAELVKGRFKQLTDLEKSFFLECLSFVATEHRLAKVGRPDTDQYNGQAALWLQRQSEKEDQFAILSYLKIERNASSESEPIIYFSRTDRTNDLANFRQGDLALLYPAREDHNPLQNQLFKGTVIGVEQHKVAIRLRARQFNHSLFNKYDHWNVEHDVLDSSFGSQYRSSFQFTAFDPAARKTYLGLLPPTRPDSQVVSYQMDELTSEQARIVKKMIQAPEFFLLWGPPGTGKTSMVLRHFVEYLIAQTQERVLILAYTNRAVDEICAALEKAGATVYSSFFRIGSRYSSNSRYHEKLLDSKISKVTRRADLIKVIQSHRIVVATISSYLGKSELLGMIHFDRLIIDEATQVLEPIMSGLLPAFEKKVLIGDHHQLASVVVQPPKRSQIQHPGLNDLGLTNLANSYFERMLLRCQQQSWDWAYDQLTLQGRMHEDLMAFPSEMFYQGALDVLPDVERQRVPLQKHVEGLASPLVRLLSEQRVLFLPVPNTTHHHTKTNEKEALAVVSIIDALLPLPQSWKSIGVITPYRAQIAMIKKHLQASGLPTQGVTVDTVERYQGSARDVIIISLCVSSERQMTTLVSKSAMGIDRKLNVALTRAREQLIVVGDPQTISIDPVYREFVKRYSKDYNQ